MKDSRPIFGYILRRSKRNRYTGIIEYPKNSSCFKIPIRDLLEWKRLSPDTTFSDLFDDLL